MHIDKLLTYFDKVKPLSGKDHYKAICPCHEDHEPSLDIKAGEKGIVMACPVCGADGKKVMQEKGLDVKELFYEQRNNISPRPQNVDYYYSDTLKKSRFYFWNNKKQKYNKSFCWWHKGKNNKWEKGTLKDNHGKSILPPLYKQNNISLAKQNKETVYIVEGEKDVDTLTDKLGLYAVCSPHGAGTGAISKKWLHEYNKLFHDIDVAIIPDNDEAGKNLANYIASQIFYFAKSVKVLDLKKEWDKLKEKGDITDIYETDTPIEGKTIAQTVKFRLTALTDVTEIYKLNETTATEAEKDKYTNNFQIPDFTYDDIKKYKADDIGTAEFFASLVKKFMCYVPEEKAFYIYNGVLWEKDVVKENLIAGKLLMNFVATAQRLIPLPPKGRLQDCPPEIAEQEQINKAFRSQYKSLGSANGRERVTKDIKKLLYKSRNNFDKQPELLNCRNCTYNLYTGKVQPHSASDMLTKCVNADYEPTAENKRFNLFVDEICEGNIERKTALQTALGYSLIGATPEECFFIAYGKSTRNGKGTLFDLILDVLGDYGLQMNFDTIARSGTKDASRPTPDLARLVGVRYVLVNEPQKGTCFNEGLTKQLTGSDNITARPLYGGTIEFKPLFTIYITTNNLPTISDDTLFTSDRIKILPFERHFSEDERDTSLKVTLRKGNGRAAVLNWLINGYQMYKEKGLTDTAAGKTILQQYRKDNDYIQQFLDENIVVSNQFKKIRLTEIQRVYNDWCKDVNIRGVGAKLFREELEKHNILIETLHGQFAVRARIIDNRMSDLY